VRHISSMGFEHIIQQQNAEDDYAKVDLEWRD
jgi:hypothetical protein